VIGAKEGDVEKAIAGAAKKIEANYHMPFLAHAAMEPMNCTVHVTKDSCEVWVGTQVSRGRRPRPPMSPACRWRRCRCTTICWAAASAGGSISMA
jgi:Molybdopterin-binding domain of aldehyde dehydrogenase.